MKRVLFLAWRYLARHRVKTAILVGCVSITICLPLAVHRLVGQFEIELTSRAAATPLVAGAWGSRFGLVLHALYFKGMPPYEVSMQLCERIRETGYAEPIPIHAQYTARGYPVVGTWLEYFSFRGLRVAEGDLPLRLGDCVLGAGVADALELGPGNALMSDPNNVFDIADSYPVRMRVVGVLAPASSPDDDAVFVDIKTAWLLQGLVHGHQDMLAETNEVLVLERSASNVVANAAVPQFMEVTAENLGSFHFHGDSAGFPVTAVLAVPHDEKSGTLLRGRFQNDESSEQLVVPTAAVNELLDMVFRVKRFFDANMAIIQVSTVMFLGLVAMLSMRLRRQEMSTMFKLGCSRGMMVKLQFAELGFVLLFSCVLSLAITEVLVRWIPRMVGL